MNTFYTYEEYSHGFNRELEVGDVMKVGRYNWEITNIRDNGNGFWIEGTSTCVEDTVNKPEPKVPSNKSA